MAPGYCVCTPTSSRKSQKKSPRIQYEGSRTRFAMHSFIYISGQIIDFHVMQILPGRAGGLVMCTGYHVLLLILLIVVAHVGVWEPYNLYMICSTFFLGWRCAIEIFRSSQHLIAAGQDVDYLDRDVSDLSDLCDVCALFYQVPLGTQV